MFPNRSEFPEDFIFGAATAAYQIEGSTFGGAGPSHWDSFAATPGNTENGQNASRACEHYHMWESDLDLMRDAGFDAYRFSTSWSRIMPDGRMINPEGLDFYDRLVDGMLERGLQPFLTLYHWDLPAALADLGGWRNRDVAAWFTDYALAVHARLGDRVQSIATLNEPWCVAWLSHFLGLHAPGIRDIRAASRAMHFVLLAHGSAIQALRAEGAKQLGIVLNFETSHPLEETPEVKRSAETQDAIYNQWFIRAIMGQSYPKAALAGMAPYLPEDWEKDMPLIAQPLDWLGVNYYTRKLHGHAPGLWPNDLSAAGPLPKNQLGWEIRPEGLTEFLLRLHQDHIGDMPVYVTENGMALEPGSDPTSDPERIAFIADHLRAAQNAAKQGVNLRGYFYWSLLDNYEWSLGYRPRFGLVHVNYETMERKPKSSWHAFRKMLCHQDYNRAAPN